MKKQNDTVLQFCCAKGHANESKCDGYLTWIKNTGKCAICRKNKLSN